MIALKDVEDILGAAFNAPFVHPRSNIPLSVGSFVTQLSEGGMECTPIASICSEVQSAEWTDAIENYIVSQELQPETVRFSTAESEARLASFGLKASSCAMMKAKAETASCQILKVTISKRVIYTIQARKWKSLIDRLEPDVSSNYVKTLFSNPVFRPKTITLRVISAVMKAAHLKASFQSLPHQV